VGIVGATPSVIGAVTEGVDGKGSISIGTAGGVAFFLLARSFLSGWDLFVARRAIWRSLSKSAGLSCWFVSGQVSTQ
jgi:hypothetical protein